MYASHPYQSIFTKTERGSELQLPELDFYKYPKLIKIDIMLI